MKGQSSFGKKYGIAWANSCGYLAFLLRNSLRSLTSLSAFSFPPRLAWARTLCRVVICVRVCNISTIEVVWFGWGGCCVGRGVLCDNVFRRYIMLMQSVNMCAGSLAYCVVLI